jgi:hypothetical protein
MMVKVRGAAFVANWVKKGGLFSNIKLGKREEISEDE